MMSRKDHEALARKLAWAQRWATLAGREHDRDVARSAVDVVTLGIAAVLAAEDPEFDADRFYAAAGVTFAEV
jgi:hypothetical protein